MFEFKNVSLSRNEKKILENCCIRFAPGDRTVITGDSGTGKTTVLNLMVGLAEADSGEILFNSSRLSPENIAEIRSKTAYISQEPSLGADTVEQALLLPFRFKANAGKQPSEKTISGIIDFLLLDKDIKSKKTAALSGGEKQRIAIARSLLTGRKIFLADEITSALDRKVTQRLFELFDSREFSLISVSHDSSWIEFCTRRLMLHDGKLTEA